MWTLTTRDSRSRIEIQLSGPNIQAITMSLATWVQEVVTARPPEVCTDVSFWDIPLCEWRRGLDEWCTTPAVRRAHGADAIAGLRAALGDFDDETLLYFLGSLA